MTAAPSARRKAAASFGRVLEEVESELAAADEVGGPFAVSFATIVAPDETRSDEAGAAWDQALAWVEATRAPPPEPAAAPSEDPPPARSQSDDPEAIAAELGLAGAASLADLRRARRRFMWANHPDRRSDTPADLANRRVAIANMLVDRAEAALGAPRRRR